MKTILLSGFYISNFEWFMILLFILGIFSGFVALIAFFIRKTDWYKNSTHKHKFAISIFISFLLVILLGFLWLLKMVFLANI